MNAVPEYDPRVIQQFAEKLYRKASAFVARLGRDRRCARLRVTSTRVAS